MGIHSCRQRIEIHTVGICPGRCRRRRLSVEGTRRTRMAIRAGAGRGSTVNRERHLDVLVVGDLFLDLVMSGFESWPRSGEESIAKKFHKEVGGGAAITACGLSKLGLQTTILGIVGKEDGQWMLDQ